MHPTKYSTKISNKSDDFGCRDLYNLPWRASVSSHQVQCNIPTFETLLWKYMYHFLERCKKSSNVWLCTLMQSDCLYSSVLFEHCNRILLCGWVLIQYSVCLRVCAYRNTFVLYLALHQGWTQCTTLDVVLHQYQVLQVSEQ